MSETLTIPMNHESSTSSTEGTADNAAIEELNSNETITITANAQDAEDATPTPSDDLILGKFKSQEDLVNAYKELEKKKSEPEAEPVVVETPTADEESEPATAGSVEDYQNKWAEQGGSLTDDQWTEIQKNTGVPMETLRAYEASMVAKANEGSEANDDAIYTAAGGQDKYDTMIEWAGKNMSDDQLASLDAQLDNPAFSSMGMSILKGAYENANGKEPLITLGETSNTSLVDTDFFQNEGELQEAMNHPEYGKGGAFDTQFDRKALGFMKATGQM